VKGSRAQLSFWRLGVLAVLIAASPAWAEYRLGVSDRVRVKVHEWPDIGGDYTVNTDGVVSMPLIGELKAAGLGVNELARSIEQRLAQRSEGNDHPFAAVEIAQYRPFFIVGDVEKPGQYPYQPGLSVLQAIGVAGGYYRQNDVAQLRLGRDLALAQGDIDAFSLRLLRLKAREARLAAVLQNDSAIAFPANLLSERSNPAVAAIIDRENAALGLESETETQNAQSVESIKTLYREEIASLSGQIDALRTEQQNVQRQLQDLRNLSGKGLALTPTMTALERTLSQISNEQLSINTAIVKAQENMSLAEQQFRDQTLARGRADMRELQQVRDEIAELTSRIGTAHDLRDEAQNRASREDALLAGDEPARGAIAVLRREGERVREIVGEDTTLLEPGDVVKVPPAKRKPSIPLSALDNPARPDWR